MSAHSIQPEQVLSLLQQGYLFLDVRSEIEFRAGHVPGAYNVPLMHAHGDQLETNPDFRTVVNSAFPGGARLIVGCHGRGRTQQACAQLDAARFSEVIQLERGYGGVRDAFGRLLPGWSQLGLPVETGDGAERAYQVLLARQRAG